MTNKKEMDFFLKSGINPDEPMFAISVVAQSLQVHQRTLRIYDEEGLLSPKRSEKNRRLYSVNDLEKGKAIQYLAKEMGINLNGIRIIFNLLDKQGIVVNDYVETISKIANEINITPAIQKENREKFSKRGRKPNKEKQTFDI